MLSAWRAPAGGTIHYDGHDLLAVPAARRPHLGIAHVPEGRGTFGDLTVLETLRVGAIHRRDKDGIEQDKAKSIVKLIKESGLKVQASIQGDELRVNGKQIDDLQSVMKLLDNAGLDVPLQYKNLKK